MKTRVCDHALDFQPSLGIIGVRPETDAKIIRAADPLCQNASKNAVTWPAVSSTRGWIKVPYRRPTALGPPGRASESRQSPRRWSRCCSCHLAAGDREGLRNEEAQGDDRREQRESSGVHRTLPLRKWNSQRTGQKSTHARPFRSGFRFGHHLLSCRLPGITSLPTAYRLDGRCAYLWL